MKTSPLRLRFTASFVLGTLALATTGCATMSASPWTLGRIDDPAWLSPRNRPLSAPSPRRVELGRPANPAPNGNVATRPVAPTPPPIEPSPLVEPLPAPPRDDSSPFGPSLIPPNAAENATPTAGLTLTVTAPPRVQVDGGCTFRLAVRNGGTAAVDDVELACDFDEALSFPGRDVKSAKQRLGRLVVGETKEVALTLVGRTLGRHCARFVVTQAGRTVAERSACVELVERRLAVEIVGPDRRTIGSRAEFTVKLTNVSNQPLSSVTVAVSHSGALVPKEASAGSIQEPGLLRWNLGDVAVGESVQPQVEFVCPTPTEHACLVVQVRGDDVPDEQLERCLTVAALVGTLDVQVTDKTDPLRIGDEGDVLVTIENRGLQPARGVTLDVPLPNHLRHVETSVSVGNRRLQPPSRLDENVVRVGPFDPIPSDVRVEVRLRLKALHTGDAPIKARVAAPGGPPTVEVTEWTTINR